MLPSLFSHFSQMSIHRRARKRQNYLLLKKIEILSKYQIVGLSHSKYPVINDTTQMVAMAI